MSDIATGFKSSGRRMTAFGIVTIILGIAAMAAPAVAGLSIIMTVGLLVAAGGVLRMIWAFGSGKFGRGVLAFAIGGLTFLCGLTLIAHPLIGSALATLLIALWLFMDGVAEIAAAFRPTGASSRVWLLLGGVASLILAAMIWRQFPLSGTWAIGILLGVKLLVVGFAMLVGGSAAKTLAGDLGALGHGRA
jgi:uncharacterized membrane protein HdeD (DUF308 family)